MYTSRTLHAIVSTCALVTAGDTGLRTSDPRAGAALQVRSRPAAEPLPPADTASPLSAAQPPAAAQRARVPSVSAQVDRLARSGEPALAFEAYLRLASCRVAQQGLLGDVAAICGDLSPGQISSRRVVLDLAAEAGVHGAALAASTEGPDDYNQTAFEGHLIDPAVRAWHRKLIRQLEIATAVGDPRSALYLWQMYEWPPSFFGAADGRDISDPEKALTYLAAHAEQQRLQAGSLTVHATWQREIDQRRAALPPEVGDAAVAEGRRIAAVHAPLKRR